MAYGKVIITMVNQQVLVSIIMEGKPEYGNLFVETENWKVQANITKDLKQVNGNIIILVKYLWKVFIRMEERMGNG